MALPRTTDSAWTTGTSDIVTAIARVRAITNNSNVAITIIIFIHLSLIHDYY